MEIILAPGEIVKPIPGWSAYECSTEGRVFSRWRPGKGRRWEIGDSLRELAQSKIRGGYRAVHLQENCERIAAFVHHLVLVTFVGECPPGQECAHFDGNRANNRLGNLRWDTRAGNFSDKRRHGTHVLGERHGMAILTAEKVAEIRSRAANGERQCDLGKEFGVTASAIHRVVSRLSWGHVP